MVYFLFQHLLALKLLTEMKITIWKETEQTVRNGFHYKS